MGESADSLMRQIQQGDANALSALMALYEGILSAHLGRYVSPPDADDLLQDLWLRVWQRARQWDGRGRPLAWLLAIGTNLALNHLRARHGEVSFTDLGGWDFADAPASAADVVIPGPEEQSLWRDQLNRVRASMAALSPDKQMALRLVRFEGFTLREAAQHLDIPIGTLKSRLHHAQRMLMEQLEEEP